MRAVTICMLDRLRDGINSKLGVQLSLPQVLEGPSRRRSSMQMVTARISTMAECEAGKGGSSSREGYSEGATWKGGREIAKQLRPETGGPPFQYVATGDVF
jgi:hypothetical protein